MKGIAMLIKTSKNKAELSNTRSDEAHEVGSISVSPSDAVQHGAVLS
jgi:hypothetical protein